MITKNLTLTITDKSVSLDKSIILYRNDRGITFNFKLVSSEYTFSEDEITSARAIIKKPNKTILVSEQDSILDGIYTFYLDGSYTDDALEIGIYTMQLQLYSDSDECITIAPFTFEIKNLIGIPVEDAALVDYSTVGYSSTRGSDVLATGDLANGEYLETVWIDKDVITSGKLNKIETVLDYLVEDAATHATEEYVNDAIANIQVGDDVDLSDYALKTEIPANMSQLTNDVGYITDISGKADVGHTHDEYLTAIPDEYITEEELGAKGYLTEHQSLEGLVSSNTVIRIEVVSELPETEENGVLYIVKGE